MSAEALAAWCVGAGIGTPTPATGTQDQAVGGGRAAPGLLGLLLNGEPECYGDAGCPERIQPDATTLPALPALVTGAAWGLASLIPPCEKQGIILCLILQLLPK